MLPIGYRYRFFVRFTDDRQMQAHKIAESDSYDPPHWAQLKTWTAGLLRRSWSSSMYISPCPYASVPPPCTCTCICLAQCLVATSAAWRTLPIQVCHPPHQRRALVIVWHDAVVLYLLHDTKHQSKVDILGVPSISSIHMVLGWPPSAFMFWWIFPYKSGSTILCARIFPSFWVQYGQTLHPKKVKMRNCWPNLFPQQTPCTMAAPKSYP